MKVKFCGMTRLEDAQEAVRLGAWAIGLIHHRPSPRFCDPDTAAEIGSALRRQLDVVGVFVNSSLEDVVSAADAESLTMLQLHGEEGPSFCREAARRTGCPVIKAVRVHSLADVQSAETYRTRYHLFDAHRPGVPGGTGESFDWGLLRGHRSEVPMIVSGGLDPENVAGAVELTRPFAVDVASGVEAEPGIKDHARMEAFFAAASAAAPQDEIVA